MLDLIAFYAPQLIGFPSIAAAIAMLMAAPSKAGLNANFMRFWLYSCVALFILYGAVYLTTPINSLPTLWPLYGLGITIAALWYCSLVAKRKAERNKTAAVEDPAPVAALESTPNVTPVVQPQPVAMGFPWATSVLIIGVIGIVIAGLLSANKSNSNKVEPDTANIPAAVAIVQATPKPQKAQPESTDEPTLKVFAIKPLNGGVQTIYAEIVSASRCDRELRRDLQRHGEQYPNAEVSGICGPQAEYGLAARDFYTIFERHPIAYPYIQGRSIAFIYKNGSQKELTELCEQSAEKTRQQGIDDAVCVLPKGW